MNMVKKIILSTGTFKITSHSEKEYLYHKFEITGTIEQTISSLETNGLMSHNTLGREVDGNLIFPTEHRIWFQTSLEGSFENFLKLLNENKYIILRISKEDLLKFGQLKEDDQYFGDKGNVLVLYKECDFEDSGNCDFAIPPKYIELKESSYSNWKRISQSPFWEKPNREFKDKISPHIRKKIETFKLDPNDINSLKEYYIRDELEYYIRDELKNYPIELVIREEKLEKFSKMKLSEFIKVPPREWIREDASSIVEEAQNRINPHQKINLITSVNNNDEKWQKVYYSSSYEDSNFQDILNDYQSKSNYSEMPPVLICKDKTYCETLVDLINQVGMPKGIIIFVGNLKEIEEEFGDDEMVVYRLFKKRNIAMNRNTDSFPYIPCEIIISIDIKIENEIQLLKELLLSLYHELAHIEGVEDEYDAEDYAHKIVDSIDLDLAIKLDNFNLFHITLQENLDDIMKNGLQPELSDETLDAIIKFREDELQSQGIEFDFEDLYEQIKKEYETGLIFATDLEGIVPALAMVSAIHSESHLDRIIILGISPNVDKYFKKQEIASNIDYVSLTPIQPQYLTIIPQNKWRYLLKKRN